VLEEGLNFRADTVLAKHDETYMPREVADSLKKQGHWQDGAPGAKPASVPAKVE
jgi:cytochrome c-type biogenesis protein CcmE